MTVKETIGGALDKARWVTLQLLGDLSDSDLLVRPVPGANHAAWQLGHLAISENGIVSGIQPGQMPPLPDGFAAKHGKEAAISDDPSQFCTLKEYLTVLEDQRNGTKAILTNMTDADLGLPLDMFNGFIKSVAEAFMLCESHETMHGGQLSVIRRKLGKPHVM